MKDKGVDCASMDKSELKKRSKVTALSHLDVIAEHLNHINNPAEDKQYDVNQTEAITNLLNYLYLYGSYCSDSGLIDQLKETVSDLKAIQELTALTSKQGQILLTELIKIDQGVYHPHTSDTQVNEDKKIAKKFVRDTARVINFINNPSNDSKKRSEKRR